MSEHIDRKISETHITVKTETMEKKEQINIPDTSAPTPDISDENRLHLMEIYLAEWQHRDELFWKQIIAYFFSTLVVILLPFLDLWGLTLQVIWYKWMFPAVGIVMAVVFFIVSQAYLARVECARIAYEDMMKTFAHVYWRKNVSEIKTGSWGKMLEKPMGKLITGVMFFALAALGVAAIIFSIIS